MIQMADQTGFCPETKEKCPYFDELQRLLEECKRLKEQTKLDVLTGLFNFSYLMNALRDEMERTRRTGLSTGLIMLDLDEFKKINDAYGHNVGNLALKTTSDILLENLRKIDIPCRYGGEEFFVILPGTRLPQAIRVADRLRRSLETKPLNVNGFSFHVTASFGVDIFTGEKNVSPEDLIQKADYFLLEAKAKGRNRICWDRSRTVQKPTEITPTERAALYGARRTDARD